ncbi:MAG: putative sulfate exporter family transporter, partial [Kiritimatiellae bacterium]|nr:putative sulfate exporter family transporter [Kiritimatiellia bacterium]
VLQWAVILLGFGLNLSVVAKTGLQTIPIILATISTALIVAYVLQRWWKIPTQIATLIGVGSSICGGSAIAATATVISAEDREVAQAISVIFFFNILAALLFPALGLFLGMDTTSGEAFGVFSGIAVNDTSSVTACAATWDSMHHLGNLTLDKAVTVKLTRTLAILPIVLVLAFWESRSAKATKDAPSVSIRKIFPFFIVWFILASIITTISLNFGVSNAFFAPFKSLSKFLIVLAMAAIGLNTDIVRLIKTGSKPLLLGASCGIAITLIGLLMMRLFKIW